MDTRTKIIDATRARTLATEGALVVSGYFDPLTAMSAEQLASMKVPGQPLVVLIRTAPNSILPARARAELVASLRCTDFVVEEVVDLVPGVALEEEHMAAQRDLIRHVHLRHQAAGPSASSSAQSSGISKWRTAAR